MAKLSLRGGVHITRVAYVRDLFLSQTAKCEGWRLTSPWLKKKKASERSPPRKDSLKSYIRHIIHEARRGGHIPEVCSQKEDEAGQETIESKHTPDIKGSRVPQA